MLMHKSSYYFINGITVYRIIAAPILLILIINQELEWFKWLLLISFFTDAIDGFLARWSHSTSSLGASLDSIGDDLTILVAFIGLFVLDPIFLKKELPYISVIVVLYLIQTIFSLWRYGKLSGFHTYLAKVATVFQAVFLLTFFFIKPISLLFYITLVITAVNLLEEIILVWMLPSWEMNVKGLYWVLKRNKVK
jgi:CDP-diacylglycerol--glycerol-3-phosphate 3-phosphatidyltransferase